MLDNIKESEILQGVRYKKGSVKLLKGVRQYYVVEKRYFLRRIPVYQKIHSFDTQFLAENKYDELKSTIWRLS